MFKFYITLFLSCFVITLYSKPYYFRNINSNNGLSSNSINTIFRDSKGFLWIGTDLGLNRYDGYRIKVFNNNYLDKNSIANNNICNITEDPEHNLWIETLSGYSIFNPHDEHFHNDYSYWLKNKGLANKQIYRIICSDKTTAYIFKDFSTVLYNYENKKSIHLNISQETKFNNGAFDHNGYLWLLDNDFMLYKIDPNSGNIICKSDYLIRKNVNNGWMYIDTLNNLWITYNDNYLVQYNTITSQWREILSQFTQPYSIRCITQYENDICIGTDHGGLCFININTFSIRREIKGINGCFLSDNTITSLFSDDYGILWVGTYKYGIDYYHSLMNSFHTYKINTSTHFNDINCFTEDLKGNLWIGTNEDGLYLKENGQEQYKKVYYCSNIKGTIVSLFSDSKGRVWIGTFMDGLYCYSNNKFKHFSEKEIIDNSVWCIGEDSKKNIWIGTLNHGIYHLDKSGEKFIPSSNNKILENTTIEYLYKKNNLLCFGTSKGICILSDDDKLIKTFEFNKSEDKTLEKNKINSLLQDSNGYYWVCTKGGLAIIDPLLKDYYFFSNKEGIEQIPMHMAIADSHNNIWVSSTKGLYCIQVIDYNNLTDINVQILKYGKEDGLQGNIFNTKAGFLTKDKKIVFGGINGYNMFNPTTIVQKKKIEKFSFTSLYVNNEPIEVNKTINGRILLKEPLINSKEIVLKYNENNIRIEFSTFDLLHPYKYKYEYKLEGFDSGWQNMLEVFPGVSYSNLPSGKYKLFIRTIDQSGLGLTQNIQIGIKVLPPFWRSLQAYLIYIIVLVMIIYYVIRNITLRASLKFKLQQQKLEQKHLKEMSELKVNFFTKLSHELKTPVSLVILPIENLLVQESNWAIKHNLNIVLRNAKKLLFIVNQLLDFRKLEAGEMSFNPMLGDLVSFVKNSTLAFIDMSQSKNIKLSFSSNVDELYIQFDPSKMERIICNLLSNAFKFTSHGGNIDVSILYEENDIDFPVKIKITDNGIGIEKKDINNIFKPFYQVASDASAIGTGIGLSITSDFVQLHNGKIDVKSEVGKGSTFIIELPCNKKDDIKIKATEEKSELIHNSTLTGFSPKKYTLLIIDDNEDFILYLMEALRYDYNILEANNGIAGFEKACKYNPDIIISDVMMPELDGIELCKKLKQEKETSNIPIILLTSSISEHHKIEGLKLGVNIFLNKPFNIDVLKAQISNLLKRQKKDNEDSSIINKLINVDISSNSLDEKLINKVISITTKNLSDSSFGIEQLSKEIGISSVYLNKKISALTGKTSSEFVRSIRIKHGATLLIKSQLSIAEIAYEVGYSEPKYFSKYFKELYGVLPSEYRKNYK